MTQHIPYPTLADAHARSADMWAAVKREGWQPGNVTTHLYGRRERTGDPELDEGLPAEGDAFIVVPQSPMRLDDLVLREALTLAEYEAIIDVYEPWSGDGVHYHDGNDPAHPQSITRHEGQLWKCLQSHISQSDWAPGVAVSLWTLAVPPGVIPEWIQPTGAHDAYSAGDRVTHNGWIWESTIDANVWEPGVYGWIQIEEL